jgi:hypothetical protein
MAGYSASAEGPEREPLRPCGPELAWDNRRVVAERSGWPAGYLEECERIERLYRGWWTYWIDANEVPGFVRPAGFTATRRNCSRCEVHLFEPNPAALEAAIKLAGADRCDCADWR